MHVVTGGCDVTCADGKCAEVLAGQCYVSYGCDGAGKCAGLEQAPGLDDNDACTKDICTGVDWMHIPYTALEIDDGNACTTDECNSSVGIIHAPVDVDDGDPCTADACTGSGVTHTPIPGCFVLVECDDYCGDVLSNCKGALDQYATSLACDGVCAVLAQGMPGDVDKFTLQCMATAADLAAVAPEEHCAAAGPQGACGGHCANFCALTMAICGDQSPPPYADLATCLTACQGYPDDVVYSASVTSGNSLACRMSHLTTAAWGPVVAMVHCPYTAADSAPCQ